MFYVFSVIYDKSAFTCTSSSYVGANTCDKLYDDTLPWHPKGGLEIDSWVNIQFHQRLRISRIELQHVSDGFFKEIRLSFSNGQSQMATLSGGPGNAWNTVIINPPVDTNYLQITTLSYYWRYDPKYGIQNIRLYGAYLLGKLLKWLRA